MSWEDSPLGVHLYRHTDEAEGPTVTPLCGPRPHPLVQREWPSSRLLPVTTGLRIILLRLGTSSQRPGGSVRSLYCNPEAIYCLMKPKEIGEVTLR